VSSLPIASYAIVSDCRSAALVSHEGSIDWLCFPRFDGPAVFARLLDDRAGHWSIRPVDHTDVSRRYLERTMVLETRWTTTGGGVALTDAMAVGRNERGHELGAGAPHVLLRRLTCLEGEVEVDIEYAPRPEYGLITPLMATADGAVASRGGADVLMLSTPVEMTVRDATASARVSLAAGDELCFGLAHRRSWEAPPPRWEEAEIEERLGDTMVAWRTWSELHQGYDGPWASLVHHSGRVLQALTYQPTGAIIAGVTTSLPETVGGERNWDYRYAWVRDASLTLEALWVAACPDEAHDFFAWMASAAAAEVGAGADLQIMFGVGGEHDLTEHELTHLSGWRGSAPVRVGNGAWSQRQLDVYGELLSAAHRLKDSLGSIDATSRRFLIDVADAAATRWSETDQGIWEVRGEPQHFVYSKLMCWVALDRSIRLAPQLGAEDRVEGWRRTRDEIRDAILERAWSDRAQAFGQAFDGDELDASALMLPIVGFVAADDPRMLATIKAIEDGLTDDHGLVFRYRAHDGLEGDEGTFLLCTFWLAHAQALAGDLDRAEATFERAASFVNDVGLLAEEVDPDSGELLGNFPQAFSHIGLVNAAWAIHEARERRGASRRSAT
jgi:GH15 family glucan-1,4-alpha-glucosidase